jgi:K(+)-stimulated pyrophosphate-energized sodium pump
VSIALTYLTTWAVLGHLDGVGGLWWKVATIISCGTLAGALIPELVKVFTSTNSRHVREVVTSSREGGPSLNILSGLVAGNVSAYWLGMTVVALRSSSASRGSTRSCSPPRCSRSGWWRSGSSGWGRSRSPSTPTAP